MIYSAVETITSQLNQHLGLSGSGAEDAAVMSNLLGQDGTLSDRITDRLVVFLVNVEKDSSAPRHPNGRGRSSDPGALGHPPVYLNLYVMIAAHFDKYEECLKSLSRAISFFQGQPILTQSNCPNLHPGIDRLVLEIENLSMHDLSNLWGVLSGRYLPSILYKVRMIAFDSGAMRPRPGVILETGADVLPRASGEG